MKNYSKPIAALARFAEVFLWIGTACLSLALIWSFFDPSMNVVFLQENGSFSALGVNVEHLDNSMTCFRILALYAIIAMGLSAMTARNINKISRKLVQSDSFSEDNTPFSADNVRMVREIGYFSISIVLTGWIASILIFFVSHGSVEVDVSMGGLYMGLIILYLSTIFAYGAQLQKDVNGLV